MTTKQLKTIQDEQEAYFNEIVSKDKEGLDVARNEYKQILKSEGLGYWVDIYEGEKGSGYIIREERTVGGKTEQKATDYGQEGRSYDWMEIKEEIA